ncbi:MAG: lytic murein transglycosylase [Beijerinckiaceae bacterium]|nr:lytic murein transglycosylase [Beijerinckiaceae bacterium]
MSQILLSLKNFTKVEGRHPNPAVSPGQILRALILIAVTIIAVAAVMRPQAGQAAESFHSFIQGLWPQAKARGVSRATFDRAFVDVTPDASVLAKTKRQAEFVRPLPVYLASAVSANRIETGQARARDWKTVLERAEREFGVDPYIILGVWGLETNFGKNPGDLSTIRCLATLAYAHYRGDYFRKELLDALDILQQGHISAQAMQGSWAGAMGQTQFMPSAFKRYAIDFEGIGHKDIWHSVPTALGSTAYYLKKHGWIAGETWGYEVIAPGQSVGHDGGKPRAFAAWAAQGYRRADGARMPERGEASLIAPAGPNGPHFLVTRNFKVIKSYNNSTAYALGVALLGERIAGSPPLRAAWPVASR